MEMKKKQNNEKGFTLIELLTAVAIIGILAATIFVSLAGQRKRALIASATESGRSVMPYAVECFLQSKTLTTWTVTTTGAGAICAGSTAEWPSLLDTKCTYDHLDTANNRWRIDCQDSQYISCFAGEGGNCCDSNASYVCN